MSKALRRAPLGFAFGTRNYERGGVYGPIRRPYLTLLAVDTGRVAVWADDDPPITLVSGECAVFYNQKSILYDYPRDLWTTVAWLECEPSGGLPPEFGEGRLLSRVVPPSARLRSLLRLGTELGPESTVHRNALRNSIGEAVLDAFVLEASDGTHDAAVPPAARFAHRYIEARYLEDIDLKQIALAARVTPQHLVSSFRKAFSVTPIRFLWQLRARAAAAELCASDEPIAEIAWRCGYRSPYHFSRHIKQLFGMPPSELRARGGFEGGSNNTDGAREIHF